MEAQKKLPTQVIQKTRKKWSEMTPKEKQETETAFQEKLRKYYANRPSREMILSSMEEPERHE